MKKLLLTLFFSLSYIGVASSAEFSFNLGASGSAGLFSASGKEINPTTSSNAGTGSETGSAAWGSIFTEVTVNDRFIVGVDYLPSALETETAETAKSVKETAGSEATTLRNNKIQVDFENLTTFYAGFMINENLYVKAGIATVDIITNEDLGTGSAYGNTDMDGSMFGVGYHNALDNGVFFRLEGNYMNFDGATQTSSTNADRKIELSSLDGISGKLSIGKTF